MRDEIKDVLIDLALKTKDFVWLNEILLNSYDMNPYDEQEELEKQIVSSVNLDHSTDVLAEIYNILNSFGWDDRLGDKPRGYDELPDSKMKIKKGTKREYISPINYEIDRRIGRKEWLRWHHKNNLNRTDDEFEAWWKTYETDVH